MENKAIGYTIVPPKGLIKIDLPELWRFRELFHIFVWRDIKVCYKQTALSITILIIGITYFRKTERFFV